MARKKIDQKDDRKTRIFLSYSRKNLAFTELLKSELEKAGYQPSLDKTDIAPGEAWQDRLGKLIQDADAVVFCLSPHSAASTICGWEVDQAAKLGKRIIPVVADPVDPAQLPDALTKLNFVFFVDTSFDEGFAKLRSALDTNLDWIRLHTRLGELALEWQSRNEASSQLLFGRSLRDAEIWSAKRPDDAELPTPLQLQYIAASRSAESGRQRFRLIAAAAVAVLSLGLFVWGEANRREAITLRDNAERLLNTAQGAIENFSNEVANTLQGTSGVPPAAALSVLEVTLNMQNDLIKNGAIKPKFKSSLVGTHIQLARNYNVLGDSAKALENANLAIEYATEVNTELENIKLKSDDDQHIQDINLYNFISAHDTLGDIKKEMNDFQGALISYQAELELALKISENGSPKTDLEAKLLLTKTNIAEAKFYSGDKEGAASLIDEVLSSYNALTHIAAIDAGVISGSAEIDHCGFVPAINLDSFDKLNYRTSEQIALALKGVTLNDKKKYSEAQPFFCESLLAAKEVSSAWPDNPMTSLRLAKAHQELANNLHLQNVKEKNMTAFFEEDEFLKITKELSEHNPDNTKMLSDYAAAVWDKTIVSSKESSPIFFANQYKLYVELILKLALKNPTDPIILQKLSLSYYDVFAAHNLNISDTDSDNLKRFTDKMAILSLAHSATLSAGQSIEPDQKIKLTQQALAALTAQ